MRDHEVWLERHGTGCWKRLQAQLAGTHLRFSEVPCSFSPAGEGVGQGHHFVLVTSRSLQGQTSGFS